MICLPWRVRKQTKQIHPFVFLGESMAHQSAFETNWSLEQFIQTMKAKLYIPSALNKMLFEHVLGGFSNHRN